LTHKTSLRIISETAFSSGNIYYRYVTNKKALPITKTNLCYLEYLEQRRLQTSKEVSKTCYVKETSAKNRFGKYSVDFNVNEKAVGEGTTGKQFFSILKGTRG